MRGAGWERSSSRDTHRSAMASTRRSWSPRTMSRAAPWHSPEAVRTCKAANAAAVGRPRCSIAASAMAEPPCAR
eukprot:6444708-Pyramimonas_sp.AAC.1